MEWIDLYLKLKKKLNSINVSYRESSMRELVNTLEMAIEDNSKYIYVTDGWEDIEIKVSEVLGII